MERVGKYYKLFTLKVNGIKYYFIGRINEGGFIWSYIESEKAVNMFEAAEKYADEHGII